MPGQKASKNLEKSKIPEQFRPEILVARACCRSSPSQSSSAWTSGCVRRPANDPSSIPARKLWHLRGGHL
jgi:hypothetical protein